MVSDEPVNFDRFRISMNSVKQTIRKEKSMKQPINSKGRPASFLRASEPPSMIPIPAIPNNVMAVRKALIAPVFFDSTACFKFAPQRLQKLKEGVIGAAQFEQYMT